MEQNKKERMILFEKKEKIGFITFNRPEKLNIFNDQMLLEYEKLLRSLDEDKGVDVVVIRGAGRAFCTGIELELMEGMDSLKCYFWSQRLQNLLLLMRNISKPIITMVQDLALAFGIGLVAASDICIAARGARFGAVAINIGLFCMGPAVFLVQNIGLKKSFELLFTGEIIDADEALRLGLVNKVVPADELEKKTIDTAKELCFKNSYALKLGKRFFYKMLEDKTLKDSELSSHYFSLLFSNWEKK